MDGASCTPSRMARIRRVGEGTRSFPGIMHFGGSCSDDSPPIDPGYSLPRIAASSSSNDERRQSEGDVLHSAAHRSVTVVTVMTLIFTPMLKNGHHWVNVLTGRTVETTVVRCEPGDPCPARKHIVRKIVLPRP